VAHAVRPPTGLERKGDRAARVAPAPRAPVGRAAAPVGSAGTGTGGMTGRVNPAHAPKLAYVRLVAREVDAVSLHGQPTGGVQPVDAMLSGETGRRHAPAGEPALRSGVVLRYLDPRQPPAMADQALGRTSLAARRRASSPAAPRPPCARS